MDQQRVAVGHWLDITIVLRSPFLSRGIEATDIVLDSHLLRNGDDTVILPGTLVRGVVRDVLQTLAQRLATLEYEGQEHSLADDLANLFGCESGLRASGQAEEKRGEASPAGWAVDNKPDRGEIDFGDLLATTPEPRHGEMAGQSRRLARVEIDDVLGAARESHLQFIELPWPIGESVTFEGRIYLRRNVSCTPARAAWLINRSLNLVPALGAVKSSGFGNVLSVLVSPAEEHILEPAAAWSGFDQVLALTFDRPFLVDAQKRNANLIRGNDVIPGSVIKGAMARMLEAGGLKDKVAQSLESLVVTHAFPAGDASEGDARKPLPLSLTRTANGLEDLLLVPDPQSFAKKDQVHRFQVDWKQNDFDSAYSRYGMELGWPPRDIRTQTAIDYDTGGADEERLFSTSAVGGKGWRWFLRLSADETIGTNERAWLLGALTSGLPGVGRTHALAKGEPISNEQYAIPEKVPPVSGSRETYAFTLETPALLNDLDALRRDGDIVGDYLRYWNEHGYLLLRFFARQELAGGHIALRYPQRSDGYEPYLLTSPGSVFLVERTGEGTRPEDLLRRGLPVHDAITRRHWSECPYLPENGFGQVRITIHGKMPQTLQPLRSSTAPPSGAGNEPDAA